MSADVDPMGVWLHDARMRSNFVQSICANWQAEQQAHEIAVLNAQMSTRTLSSQIFFRFAPMICLLMTPEFKARLGVTSMANVTLYANQGQHTRERHPKEAFEILAALSKAEEHLTYIGRSRKGDGQFELLFNHKVGSHLFMPIKFVPAGPRATTDECWIGTAYVIDDEELQKKIRTKRLIPAQCGSNDPDPGSQPSDLEPPN
jgi:hypothetical protein